jgi:hypothetical protein
MGNLIDRRKRTEDHTSVYSYLDYNKIKEIEVSNEFIDSNHIDDDLICVTCYAWEHSDKSIARITAGGGVYEKKYVCPTPFNRQLCNSSQSHYDTGFYNIKKQIYITKNDLQYGYDLFESNNFK